MTQHILCFWRSIGDIINYVCFCLLRNSTVVSVAVLLRQGIDLFAYGNVACNLKVRYPITRQYKLRPFYVGDITDFSVKKVWSCVLLLNC